MRRRLQTCHFPGPAYFAALARQPDEEALHAGIRDRAARIAEQGDADVFEALRSLHERLVTRLAEEPLDRLVRPFGVGVFLLDDYLASRVVELVVHGDDIAVSCELETDLPASCLTLAVDHLLAAARYMHGDLSVLRALARHERVDDVMHVI